MDKTFAQTFDEIYRRQYDEHLMMEKERVHQDTIQDEHHAFTGVELKKPLFWNNIPMTRFPL